MMMHQLCISFERDGDVMGDVMEDAMEDRGDVGNIDRAVNALFSVLK